MEVMRLIGKLFFLLFVGCNGRIGTGDSGHRHKLDEELLRMISTNCNNNLQVTTSHWNALDVGWVKLNMDGVVSASRYSASIGGAFRDENEIWLRRFSMRLAVNTVFKIELELECNNALLVETILAGGATDGNLKELQLIYQLVNQNWKVCIPHIPKTHNKIVDHLAKCIATGFMRLQLIEEPPPLARDLILIEYNDSMLSQSILLCSHLMLILFYQKYI
ncbi:hypothetical protein J1N35_039068 [Gossypium stocksii]|uniref:RNase H type-1 domain-containing protein n=1 Tax=Gossypium stocksii TaxID=47602 RepID=A0A9D3UQ19_9ROSI|nr:hypothetical protein J1N35_039068 [Gossypium stocksii]